MSNFDKAPCQYAIYKGKGGKNGVLQFDLKPFDPDRIDNPEMDVKLKKKIKKGCVFIDAAKATAKDVYDYKNGIKFSMSEGDLAEFLAGTHSLKKEGDELVNIYHEITREGVTITKSLKVKQGNQDKQGRPTFMVSLSANTKGDKDKGSFVVVPVSLAEMFALRQLFLAALPRIMGW